MVRRSHLRIKYYFRCEIWKIYNEKELYKKKFFVHSINMPNIQQNNIQNEIEQIKKRDRFIARQT